MVDGITVTSLPNSSSGDPGVDDRHAAALEIVDVARRDRGAGGQSDRRDLGVQDSRRSADALAGAEDFAVVHCGGGIESEEAAGKILLEQALRVRRQASLAATVGQQRDAVEHL